MTDKICNTSLTEGYLTKCLQESFGPHAVLRSMACEQVALGEGFLSSMVRVRLMWEEPAPSLPNSVIVKIPLTNSINDVLETMQIDAGAWENVDEFVTSFHKAECDIYSLFQNDAPVPIPTCYLAAAGQDITEMIIMEDMSSKASVIPSMITGISLPQLFNVTTEMAKLHGWSLTTSTDWRNRIKDIADFRPTYEPMFAAMRKGYQTTKRDYPDQFGAVDTDELCAFLTFDNYLKYSNDHRFFMSDVLIHGDCWANNIMFEKNPDGSVGDRVAALIDWQIATKGSPMADLARMMSWSVAPDIRRTHIDHLISHYYRLLKSIAKERVTATVDQMKHWYNRHFAFNVLYILTALKALSDKFAKGEGEEKEKQILVFVERMKVNFEDAMLIVQNGNS